MNVSTTPYHYLFSIIEVLLEEIKGKVFSVIDHCKPFYQNATAKKDISKMAIITPFELSKSLDHLWVFAKQHSHCDPTRTIYCGTVPWTIMINFFDICNSFSSSRFLTNIAK